MSCRGFYNGTYRVTHDCELQGIWKGKLKSYTGFWASGDHIREVRELQKTLSYIWFYEGIYRVTRNFEWQGIYKWIYWVTMDFELHEIL